MRIKPTLAYKLMEATEFGGAWKCNLCGMVCESKQGLGRHLSVTHQIPDWKWTPRRVLRVMITA